MRYRDDGFLTRLVFQAQAVAEGWFIADTSLQRKKLCGADMEIMMSGRIDVKQANARIAPITGIIRIMGYAFFALLSACSSQSSSPLSEPVRVDYNLLLSLPARPISYEHKVRPILERRCVVCHGCYDAPCQLKLSSYEGLLRGANRERVYDGRRILGVQPTRLFIDAKTTRGWRERDFFPVLNEVNTKDPQQNLENSLLYQMLRLKQRHPQPRVGRLPDNVDISLDRKQICPSMATFPDYVRKTPTWGMPYAMPNLTEVEYRTLVQWLAQGAPRDEPAEISDAARSQVEKWEVFLNGSRLRQKLVSRYLYEHLFLAHIHFENAPTREFFRLVRSRTGPTQAVDEIASIRPFDDPGTTDFYYRFVRYTPSIVAKNHVVYRLSDARMRRYDELFFKPDYPVRRLPSYRADVASNPLRAFAAIPPTSRYRFLLDDARFFIEGFIKGPVCRGQVALNVIEDRFWVVFLNPRHKMFSDNPAFLDSVSEYLQLPAERGDTFNMFSIWTDYWQRYQHYVEAREAYFSKMPTADLEQAMNHLWDGDGRNRNAALTIFRHFDSASVRYGLVGDYPETAWVIDYPLLERIHYLLVAGFNVYGNIGHQLNTRLYMNFLRMEGEDNFLAFIPSSQRTAIRNSWYIGMRSRQKLIFSTRKDWLSIDRVSGYQSDDPQRELYQHIQKRLAAVASLDDDINRCPARKCEQGTGGDDVESQTDQSMREIARIRGEVIQVFPDLAYVRVKAGRQQYLVYSLIRDKAYKNLSSFMANGEDVERDIQDIKNDRMTVLKGLEGAYPNFFFDVKQNNIEQFAHEYAAIRNMKDYERFVARFGVRRTQTDFWKVADWFQARYAEQQPLLSGLLDLNRYRNR
ncbi:MAG TPA: isomerase [Gammaproteobacteria bacterium]|nr:isomerase [Gammaproteobacteria bacterium]